MHHPKIPLFFIVVITLLFYVSCKKVDSNSGEKDSGKHLTITGISDSSGVYNTSVVIRGTGFSSNPSLDKVTFNGKSAIVTAATITAITATVPKGAGKGKIGLSVGGVTIVGPSFNYKYTVTVSTLAGSGRDTVIDGTGGNASFHGMWGIASDSKGNIYAPDPEANVIRKVTPDGVVTTFAGSGKLGYADGKGRMATFGTPQAVVVDSADNVFVTDCYYKLIRKITPDGTVTTLVNENGTFRQMEAFAIDKHNNMYLADFNTIYEITPRGVVTALTGVFGPVLGMALDQNGIIYISGDICVYTIKTLNGPFGLYAGNEQQQGYADGPALQAKFKYLSGLVFDRSGNLFVADTDNSTIREVTTDGKVTTVAGVLPISYPLVDGPASIATFYAPFGLTIDSQGNLYVQDEIHEIRKITFE